MPLWDATTGWVTLVVRARSQEEARKIATEQIEALKLEDSVDLAFVPDDWPRELDPEGPAGIVVEDIS